jgi:protein disulfide-isomerase
MKLTVTLATAISALAAAASFAADTPAAQNPSTKLAWQTDYLRALEQARKEKKYLLLDFTGSDWCAPCIKLKKEVFDTAEFKAFADKHLVCVEVDFPRRQPLPEELASQNAYLQSKFKVKEFPTIIILDSDGRLLGSLPYKEGGHSVWLPLIKQTMAKAAN